MEVAKDLWLWNYGKQRDGIWPVEDVLGILMVVTIDEGVYKENDIITCLWPG